MRNRLLGAAIALGFALLGSCSGKDDPAVGTSPLDADASSPVGGGVGAKCTEDSQCSGYTSPVCEKDIKPIAPLVSANDPKNQIFLDFHIPFPGGYCSNGIENSCRSDDDCGAGAGCFRPFEGV